MRLKKIISIDYTRLYAIKTYSGDSRQKTRTFFSGENEIEQKFKIVFNTCDRISIVRGRRAQLTAFVTEHARVTAFVAARVDEFSLFALVERHAAAGARLVAIAAFLQQLPYGCQICEQTERGPLFYYSDVHVPSYTQPSINTIKLRVRIDLTDRYTFDVSVITQNTTSRQLSSNDDIFALNS